MSLPDFLGVLLAKVRAMHGSNAAVSRVIQTLTEAQLVYYPTNVESAIHAAWTARLEGGAVPTSDRIGVMLPPHLVDCRYLETLVWPARTEGLRSKPDERLLNEAQRRLQAGDIGTALVVARNFRFHYWYSDWKSGRHYIRQTSDILSAAYVALSRPRAAAAISRQTAAALENVL